MKRYYITKDFGEGIYNSGYSLWKGRPCYSKYKSSWDGPATSKHIKTMCVEDFERINDIRLKGGPRSIIEIKGFKVIPAKDEEEGLWLFRDGSFYKLFYGTPELSVLVESFCGTEFELMPDILKLLVESFCRKEFELMTDILKLGEKDKIKIKGFKTIRVKKTINKKKIGDSC